jgi:transcription antitermination factor NusG
MRELCPWYALSVKHQHEQAACAALAFAGFAALAPRYRARRNWSDRVKELDLPLFAGYIFCRFDFDRDSRKHVLNIPGVSRVVSFGGKPAPLASDEIAAIQQVMAAGVVARPWPHLMTGDAVRIERGPLRGIEGRLLREAGQWQLVIGVELLQRSVAVTLDPSMITPLPHAAQAPLAAAV